MPELPILPFLVDLENTGILCMCVRDQIINVFLFFWKNFPFFSELTYPAKPSNTPAVQKVSHTPSMATQIILSGFTPNWNLILQGSV